MSPLLFISRSRSLSPFFSLSFAGMPPTFSFSLSFSCSIFQFFGNDNSINLSFSAQINCHVQKFGEVLQYFRQHGYRNNFCFPFSSLLTLQLSLLYKSRVAMRFPAQITSSCIWVAIPVDWLILHWYACDADRRSVARSGGVRSRKYQTF